MTITRKLSVLAGGLLTAALLPLGAPTALADTAPKPSTTIDVPALDPLGTVAHPVTLGGIGCCWG